MNQEQRYIRGKKKPNLSNLYSTLFMSRTDLIILSTRCFEHSYLHGRRTGHRSSLKVLSAVHTLSQLIKGSLLFRSCLRRLDLRAYLKGHTSLDVNSCKGHRGHQTKELKGVFNVCDVHVCREALGQSPGASSAPPPSRSPKGHLKLLRSSTLLSPSGHMASPRPSSNPTTTTQPVPDRVGVGPASPPRPVNHRRRGPPPTKRPWKMGKGGTIADGVREPRIAVIGILLTCAAFNNSS
ncbi:hypothetical protein BHE74_00017780 [Ensete ventricosum]|nr:hypothetical protein BHE74_00017780 [Ensete ventricosum]